MWKLDGQHGQHGHAGRPGPMWRMAVVVGVALVALLVAACGSSSAADSGPYGGASNHLHDMLALQGVPNTLLVASHFGIYRTADAGKTWTQVAGGDDQSMAGLMPYKLVQSPTNPKRVYVPGIPRILGQKSDTPGIYMSTDAGQTWKMVTPMTAFPGGTVYSIGQGAKDGQLYALMPTYDDAQPYALYVTNDNGGHWQRLPNLPTTTPTGVTADTHRAGRLILWSSTNGIYLSDDSGKTWHRSPSAQQGVNAATVVGGNIYAVGDSIIYASHDDGDTFTPVTVKAFFSAVQASAARPQDAYAMTNNSIYATTDGGKTWHTTAAQAREPAELAADPANGAVVYVGYNLPIGVQVSADNGGSWDTIMP